MVQILQKSYYIIFIFIVYLDELDECSNLKQEQVYLND